VRRGGASAELLALAATGLGPCHARRNGFDLHAGRAAGGRARAQAARDTSNFTDGEIAGPDWKRKLRKRS